MSARTSSALAKRFGGTPLEQGGIGVVMRHRPTKPLAATVEELVTGKPVPTGPGIRPPMSLPATVAQKFEQAMKWLFPVEDLGADLMNPMAAPVAAVVKPVAKAVKGALTRRVTNAVKTRGQSMEPTPAPATAAPVKNPLGADAQAGQKTMAQRMEDAKANPIVSEASPSRVPTAAIAVPKFGAPVVAASNAVAQVGAPAKTAAEFPSVTSVAEPRVIDPNVASARSAASVKPTALTDAQIAQMKVLAPGQPFKFTQLPAAARPAAVHRAILQNGGYSVHPTTGHVLEVEKPGPTMVGIYPNQTARTFTIPLASFNPKSVEKFFQKNRDVFAKNDKAYIGGWKWKKDGQDLISLDVSQGYPDVRSATKVGELQNPGTVRGRMDGKPTGAVREPITSEWPRAQEAVFHPETMAEPKIRNWHDWVTGPEFQARLHEQAKIGHDAMGQNKNWWDIRGGRMGRVYGEENLRPVAGMIAGTSPQNNPVSNMQLASEYIRRRAAGEPILQPGWRAGADTMGDQAKIFGDGASGTGGFSPTVGAKMPNEGTYGPNMVRAALGQEVKNDKVNDMFHALLGDNVGVFDRHYAKIGEAPELGVYIDSVPNRISGSMDTNQISSYAVIENEVRRAAKDAGVPLSQFSAWVWEGVRDTIRKTGTLYGQQHRASAIPSTTQGFPEIFDALLTKKAKHLGVTEEVLEAELSKGTQNLLSLVLSSGAGLEALRRWMSEREQTPSGGQR